MGKFFSKSVFVSALCGAISLFCAGSKPALALETALSSFASLKGYLSVYPNASMEDLLAALDPKIRANFQLVYDSRSPVGASLEMPRVVLSNKDASFILAFAGHEDMKSGNLLEMIEFDRQTSEFKFRKITFGAAGTKAQVDENPQTCINCHGKAFSKTPALKPNWDSYPDWPGVFGSSHNNILMERTGLFGTSGIPDFEFETKAFEIFKNSTIKEGRYQFLEKTKDLKLHVLAERSGDFTDQLVMLNAQRLAGQAIKRAKDIEASSPTEYLKVRRRILRAFEHYRTLGYSEPVRDSTPQYLKQSAETKKYRILEIVERLGTENDKKSIQNLKIVVPGFQEYNVHFNEAPYLFALSQENLTMLTLSTMRKVLRIMGVDDSTLSTNLELNSYDLSNPDSLNPKFREFSRQIISYLEENNEYAVCDRLLTKLGLNE